MTDEIQNICQFIDPKYGAAPVFFLTRADGTRRPGLFATKEAARRARILPDANLAGLQADAAARHPSGLVLLIDVVHHLNNVVELDRP